MRKYLYPLLTVIVIVGLYYAEQYASRQTEAYPDTSNENTAASSEEFLGNWLPQSTTGVIVKHGYFTLSYAEEHEQAEWVAYPLLKEHIVYTEIERPDFVEDRKVKTKSAHWRSYKNSGYDRGHLCPAGDRRFSYEAYHETFLTSNISPQNHDFNGGVWNSLEQKTRSWAKKYNGVYVVTGGVLEDGLSSIGTERVSVPKEFYKIIVDKYNGSYKAIAFLIPNQPSNGSYFDYVVSIDEIEKRTGINFFADFPSEIETKLEATINVKAWGRK